MSKTFAFWTIGDQNHGKMAATMVASARSVGVTAPIHVFTDLPNIDGAIVHPCGIFDKTLYMFKFHFLKNEMKKLPYDFMFFLDTDNIFTRNPGDLAEMMGDDKVFVQMENEIILDHNHPGKSHRQDWWGCPVAEFGPFMKSIGVTGNRFFNCNAGFWGVAKTAIDEFYDKATYIFNEAHKRGYTKTTEEFALAGVGMCLQDPLKRTLDDTSWLWCSDWTDAWKGQLPTYNFWQFEDYMNGQKKNVRPCITHCMRSKTSMVAKYDQYVVSKKASEKASENWIVTACDSNAFTSMLVSFIASARGVAKWSGNIAVVDLGMTDEQKNKLKSLDIQIFNKANKSKSIVCDRFFSLYDNMNSSDLYAHFDADIWFTDNIDDLFKNYNGKFTCTVDCNYQGFITGVIPNEELRKSYKIMIDEMVVEKNNGKPLQVGFVFGNKTAYTGFNDELNRLIETQVAADAYGTDTLAINTYYAKNPSKVNVMNIAYNCLPDWNPQKVQDKFVLKDIVIRAIHQTSPYRKVDMWSFDKNYPDIYNKWKKMLTNEETSLQQVVVKGNNFLIRPGTWDHTILHHTDEYSVSKYLSFPADTCIVDIGGHIGGFTKIVAKQYPNVPVYTFEPDPDNYDMLMKNVSGLSNVTVFNVGIGAVDTQGSVEIPSPGNTGMNRVSVGYGSIKIISPKTLMSLVKQKNIGLMKIDCEGGEWGFFDTIAPDELNRIWEIQGELHTDLYNRYGPFKDYPMFKEDFLRDLMKKNLPMFSVFIELGRTLKAYNKVNFL